LGIEAGSVVLDERRFAGRQGRLLFAYLVTAHGRPVPRDELAAALWGDEVPATWDKALSVLVSKLRAVLSEAGIDGASALTAAHGCYRLDLPDGTWVDVLQAEGAAMEAEALLAAGDATRAKIAAALAESVAGQPLLPGDDGAWVQSKRRELADIRVRALSALAESSLRSGDTAEAIRWAEQEIEAEPFRESGYRRLMAAHIASGDRAEALRVYEHCRRLLAEELGAYPSPETEAVYRELLEEPRRTAFDSGGAPPAAAPPKRRRSRGRGVVGAAALLVAGAIAAGFAVADHGRSAPTVVPDSLVRIDPSSLEVKQVIRVGSAPDLVVESGGYLWVTSHILRDTESGAIENGGSHTLTRVDPATGKSTVVGGGVVPCGITPDPSGDVWVANCFAPGAGAKPNVIRVDAATTGFKEIVVVPGGNFFYRGIAYGGGSLWVSDPSTSGVTRIDPQTRVQRAIPFAGFPGALAWSEGYGDLWVANFSNGTLTRLHAGIPAVHAIEGVATSPASIVVDGGDVWVADWSAARVVRFPAVGPGRVRSVRLPVRNPRKCLSSSCVWTVAAGAGAIWATTPRYDALWRIDEKTDEVTRIRFPYPPAGVTADASDVWVTVRAEP
jgi:SARP family transcriptional regulator, regulator of embCAB operon